MLECASRIRSAALAVLTVLATSAPLLAQSTARFGDLTISVVSPPSETPYFGYNEYAVTLRNHGKASHAVKLTLPAESYHPRGDYLRSLSRTVEVGPEETARVSLFQSVWLPIGGSGLRVEIDGTSQNQQLRVQMTSSPHERDYGMSVRGSSSCRVLASRSLPQRIKIKLQMFIPRLGEMPPGFDPQPVPPGFPQPKMREDVFIEPGMPQGMFVEQMLCQPELPVNNWSSSWLAYTSFHGVIVTADDMRKASPEVRAALFQYAECGGCLYIVGAYPVPASWPRASKPRGLEAYRPGFGQCFVQAVIEDDPDLQPYFKALGLSGVPFQQGMGDVNRVFPVVDDIGIPVRGLFILMIVFSVAIGPLNLMTLSRMKRRIWMLWTVPAISLFTCLAVFGYMIVSEGWEGHLRTATITVLDENTHRAATIGWTGLYAPMTPSDGLHFSSETEVSPIKDFNPYDRSGTAHSVDWSNDQHLVQGWISARIPAHFMVRKNEVRRERVTFRREGNVVTAVNGLGADIKVLRYLDDAGQLYQGGPIPAGGEATLSASNERPLSDQYLRQNVFAGSWILNMNELATKGSRFLTPNTYLAELESAPFVEEPLTRLKARKEHAFVFGLLKEREDEN